MLAWGCLPAAIVILDCIIAPRNRFVNTTFEDFSVFPQLFFDKNFCSGPTCVHLRFSKEIAHKILCPATSLLNSKKKAKVFHTVIPNFSTGFPQSYPPLTKFRKSLD